MTMHFHKLTISDIRSETNDCVSIAFDIPEHLKEQFAYREGQNITIRLNLNGEEIRRSYSVCSSPLENELRIAVKSISDGRFSNYANKKLKINDQLEVLPPTGKFYPDRSEIRQKEYLAFAAGSGITPVISILKTVLATEPQSRFTLVFGNRNRSSIIFREQLEGLKNKYMDRFRLIHILSREITEVPLLQGRIDAEKCEALARVLPNWDQVDHYFLCGPEQMIFSVRDYLISKAVKQERIHFELFNTPVKSELYRQVISGEETESGQMAKVIIRADGRTVELQVPYNGAAILDAALQTGADLPYACKGGVCCTCRAKLVSGQVKMDTNYALEQEELSAGYILTCQSHPRSPEVLIDFDQK